LPYSCVNKALPCSM